MSDSFCEAGYPLTDGPCGRCGRLSSQSCGHPPIDTRNEEIRALIRERDEAIARAERFRDALISINEFWNRDQNEKAMIGACWHAVETSAEALNEK